MRSIRQTKSSSRRRAGVRFALYGVAAVLGAAYYFLVFLAIAAFPWWHVVSIVASLFLVGVLTIVLRRS